MASEAPNRVPKKTLPASRAKTPLPGVKVDANPEEPLEEPGLSPWEWHGWGYSIAAHALLLIVLGLWYFTPKVSKVTSFDTKIAGTDFGDEDGMTALGGLDTPVSMPEFAPTAPSTASTFERPQPSEMPDNPTAGFQGNTGNPGAGQGDGFGLARFGNGGEQVRGVAIKVGDPQFTLIWDTKVDLDLHVIEPGGKEIFWNDRQGRLGGELDVDNVDGFGPENIYWMKVGEDGKKELGPGPPGEYKWWVNYYGGNGGIVTPTRWKVRVKHEGKVEVFQGKLTAPGPNGNSKRYTLTVSGPPGAPSGER